MKTRIRWRLSLRGMLGRMSFAAGLLAAFAGTTDVAAQEETVVAPPAPPASASIVERAWDGGDAVVIEFMPSPDESLDIDNPGKVIAYRIERTRTEAEIDAVVAKAKTDAVAAAIAAETGAYVREALNIGESVDWEPRVSDLTTQQRDAVRAIRTRVKKDAEEAFQAGDAAAREAATWTLAEVQTVPRGASPDSSRELVIIKLAKGEEFSGRVRAISSAGGLSEIVTTETVTTRRQMFDGSRLWLLVILLIFGGAVIYFILMARSGRTLKVRKIAGLEAIDEAVGRATEMGRSVLFVPGIQDMNEIQTIAGITILARVAKTAAEYDAKVEVPTARSLVMATARETVQAAYLGAGRPDAYNEDLIYYVTNEQFGYVAYLSGMMVRDKPAACIYMGAFYAESLILAETGNAIGAIQVAGTAQPAQLPFFVAACDYTLIGEEFFAASAYLSGSPEELGSLKGQDVGKLLVGILIVVGAIAATIANFSDSSDGVFDHFTAYLKSEVLN